MAGNPVSWDTEQLMQFLVSKKVTEEYISKLTDNQIDGDTFQSVTNNDLKDMGLTLVGPNKKLLKLIEVLYDGNNNDTTERAVGRNTAPSVQPNANITVAGDATPTFASENSTASLSKDLHEEEYNVIEILNNSGKVGSDIVKAFVNSNEETVSSEERIKVVQICVDFLLSLPTKWYPTSEMKLKMAKAIISAFPCLAYAGDKPWRAFYDSDVRGYLDMRLVHVRKDLALEDRKRKNEKVTDEKKKYEKRPKGCILSDSDVEISDNDDVQYKIEFMKTHPSTADNLARISEYWKDTYPHRVKLLAESSKKKQRVSFIFDLFPRIRDFENGKLIIRDFFLTYPKAKDFDINFIDKFGDKLKALVEKCDLELPSSTDDCLQLLLAMLKNGVMVTRSKKESYESRRDQLIRFIPDSADIQGFLEGLNRKKEKLLQPFLFAQGTEENPASYFLVIEDSIIPCGRKSSEAFQNLFASFFIFHLGFPTALNHFFKFFEEIVFGISKATPSTIEFVNKLK